METYPCFGHQAAQSFDTLGIFDDFDGLHLVGCLVLVDLLVLVGFPVMEIFVKFDVKVVGLEVVGVTVGAKVDT